MYMRKIITLNWGQLPNREYPLSEVNLLTGGSGSGKTTLGDAIQTVITAARRGSFQYNPGQDEATQGGKHGKVPRTAASYALGAEAGNVYMRPLGSHTYIAIAFAPHQDEGEGGHFTALIAIAATLEGGQKGGDSRRVAREDDFRMIVVEGHEVAIDNLIELKTEEATQVFPTGVIVKVLRERYGRQAVLEFSDKQTYLQKLYGLLRGERQAVAREAFTAATAFSRFMAYKPIKSIPDFVREEVLPVHDMGQQIHRVQGMMQEIAGLRAESERIGRNLKLMAKILKQGEKAFESRREGLALGVVRALKEELDLSRVQHDEEQKMIALQAESERFTAELGEGDEQIERLNRERIELDTQRREHDVARTKDELEGKLNEVQAAATGHYEALYKALEQLHKNLDAVDELAECPGHVLTNPLLAGALKPLLNATLPEPDFDALNSQLVALARGEAIDSEQLEQLVRGELEGLDARLEPLYRTISDPETGVQTLANRALGGIEQERRQLEQQLAHKERDLDRLRSGGTIRYPQETERALEMIEQSYPRAHPLVMCELIEMAEPDWQNAIEGLMGFDRYNLIVEREFESDCLDLLVRQRLRTKLIQGRLVLDDARKQSLRPGSIVEALHIDHPVAQAYIKLSYGGVMKVADQRELARTRRGLTREGHSSGGYAMTYKWADSTQLTFGKSARAQRIPALEQELEGDRLAIAEIQARGRDYHQLSRLASAIREQPMEPHARTLVARLRELERLRSQIENLDLAGIENIEEKLTKLDQQLTKLKAEEHTMRKGIGQNEERVKQLQASVVRRQAAVEAAQSGSREAWNRYRALSWPGYAPDWEQIEPELYSQATGPLADPELISENEIKQEKSYREAKNRFAQAVSEYNRQCRPNEQVPLDAEAFHDYQETGTGFPALTQAYQQTHAQLQRQEESGLAAARERLEQAQREVQTAFTTDFCESLLSALNEGESRLFALNLELNAHRFGDERYRFAWKWRPEFKRYYDLFQAIHKLESLGETEDLFGEALPENLRQTRDELIELLLSEETEKAQSRLMVIADYRNYRGYEIYKETGSGDSVALSTYGTGSGGQLETPVYVIRFASLANAFRLRDGNRHLRSCLIDESFSKMDDPRSRAVIAYLRQQGFQVTFIMPTRASGSLKDTATTQYVFSKVRAGRKIGELDTMVLTEQITHRQEEFQQLWQRHRAAVKEEVTKEFENGTAEELRMAV